MIRNIHIWGPSIALRYAKKIFSGNRVKSPKHVLFCMADHFEPGWENADLHVMRHRVDTWSNLYPKLMRNHRDSNGRPARHTWFYAVEQYEALCVQTLQSICDQGYGEIELHLHHENDTREGLIAKLEKAKADFAKHGSFISRGPASRHAFGFIHGDWALNNSRNGNDCGVDNELKILRDAGCYADFTLPSAPHESQTSKINSIYYAQDIPGRRKSHDRGIDVAAGGKIAGDLMLIQGPLALNWKRRKYKILPSIENGIIHKNYPATPDRIHLWINQHIHVLGRPEWIFVKIHCHGAQEQDREALLGTSADQMYSFLEKHYNDGKDYILHYVTAREMFNIIKAAEEGKTGNPFQYKDHIIKPYIGSGCNAYG